MVPRLMRMGPWPLASLWRKDSVTPASCPPVWTLQSHRGWHQKAVCDGDGRRRLAAAAAVARRAAAAGQLAAAADTETSWLTSPGLDAAAASSLFRRAWGRAGPGGALATCSAVPALDCRGWTVVVSAAGGRAPANTHVCIYIHTGRGRSRSWA